MGLTSHTRAKLTGKLEERTATQGAARGAHDMSTPEKHIEPGRQTADPAGPLQFEAHSEARRSGTSSPGTVYPSGRSELTDAKCTQ